MKIVIAVKRDANDQQTYFALQQAMAEAFLKQDNDALNTLVVVSIGASTDTSQLKDAMDLGAHKGIHVITHDSINAYSVAEQLQRVIAQEEPELIIISPELTGEHCRTGKILSALLDESTMVMNASHLNRNQYRLLVIREMNSGAYTVLLPIQQATQSLPARWRDLTRTTTPILLSNSLSA